MTKELENNSNFLVRKKTTSRSTLVLFKNESTLYNIIELSPKFFFLHLNLFVITAMKTYETDLETWKHES